MARPTSTLAATVRELLAAALEDLDPRDQVERSKVPQLAALLWAITSRGPLPAQVERWAARGVWEIPRRLSRAEVRILVDRGLMSSDHEP